MRSREGSGAIQNLTKSMLTLAEAEQEDWLNIDKFDVVQMVDGSGMLQSMFQRQIRVHTSAGNLRMSGDKDKIAAAGHSAG